MKHLRDPDRGCPWDLKQNFASIAPYTIEEAYEVADAIERQDLDDLKDELGDLLFQVVFHSQMAQETQEFGFADVVTAICDKLERRHPHVFGDARIDDAEQQTVAWEKFKDSERQQKSRHGDPSVLDDIGVNLPSLLRAEKLQKRVARVGFDWPETAPVIEKISEELGEVKQELNKGTSMDSLEMELGDLLFAVVNLARHAGVNPESALRRSNAKFESRFREIEKMLGEKNIALENAGLQVLEAYYQQVKARESGKDFEDK